MLHLTCLGPFHCALRMILLTAGPVQVPACRAPGLWTCLRPTLPGKSSAGLAALPHLHTTHRRRRRLEECLDLLRVHLLPRLRLRELHALSQVNRTLRQAAADSDTELETLALVQPQSCLLSPCHQARSQTPVCVQTLMPSQHLASQAPPTASTFQQLRGLASLHARIRLGQPALTSELHVLPTPGNVLQSYCQSPATTSAVLIWGHNLLDGFYPETVSAEVVGQDAGGVHWSNPQPSEVSFVLGKGGFSRDGRYCTTVMETGYHCHEECSTFPPDKDLSQLALVARTFNVQKRCWLPQRRIFDTGFEIDELHFSHQSGPLAAAVQGSRALVERMLIVFGILEPWVQVIRLPGIPRFYWLRVGALALLSDKDDTWTLALTVLPGSTAAATCTAIQTSGEYLQVTVADTGEQALWVSHALGQQQGSSCDGRVMVYDPANLVCLASWDLKLRPADYVSVQISPHAAFVSHYGSDSTVSGTCVYELVAPGRLGQLLYRTGGLPSGLCFNSCFVLAVMHAEIRVLDAHTGETIFKRRTPTLCSLAGARMTAAAWSSQDPGQLLVTCTADSNPSVSLLQF